MTTLKLKALEFIDFAFICRNVNSYVPEIGVSWLGNTDCNVISSYKQVMEYLMKVIPFKHVHISSTVHTLLNNLLMN